MKEVEKSIEISMLLQIYGKLLTEKQYNLLDDYYNNDLSLAEIAENEGITRQAVRDNLKKGENNLYDFENKLEIMKQEKSSKENLENIIVELSSVIDETSEENGKKLKNIKRKLEKLI